MPIWCAVELAGSDGPIGPNIVTDIDLPPDANRYDISQIPGAHLIRADDRRIIDAFASAAHAMGLGQRKFSEAVSWCLGHTGPITEALAEEFFEFGMSHGWPDEFLNFCVQWVANFDPDAPAATPRGSDGQFVGKAAVEDERAAIELMMGDPSSPYWRGARSLALQQRYRELLAAG